MPITVPGVFPNPRSEITPAQIVSRLASALSVEPPTFLDFFRGAWTIIEPATPYIASWHIEYIGEHLAAVDLGQIRHLSIAIPPRHLKSTIVTICWPVWSWIQQPWLQWMFASYSAELAADHSLKRRWILESPWYQRQWGDLVKLAPDQNQKDVYQTTARGKMQAIGIGGSATGLGGHRLVGDDLINAKYAESEAHRKDAVNFWKQTMATRLNDPKNGHKILVAQRTHPQDVQGAIAKEAGWTHVVIPQEAPKQVSVLFPISRRVITRQEGELICPDRIATRENDELKETMGTRAYQAQCNQNPSSEEGGILKRGWWKFYKPPELPEALLKASAWDTAAGIKTQNDYTANCRGQRAEAGYYVTGYLKRKLEYPMLRRVVQARYDRFPADIEVIEDKSSGQSLIQDLRVSTTLPVIAVSPDKDKVWRANQAAPSLEAGKWYLPEPGCELDRDDEGKPWVESFIENCAAFPAIEHDDDVDAWVHLAMYLIGKYGGNVMLSIA